jgi:hypothetical protein
MTLIKTTKKAQETYYHAGTLTINNRPGQEGLDIYYDERGVDDDELIAHNFDKVSINFAQALADPELVEQVGVVYHALRAITLKLTERRAAEVAQPEPADDGEKDQK